MIPAINSKPFSSPNYPHPDHPFGIVQFFEYAMLVLNSLSLYFTHPHRAQLKDKPDKKGKP